MMSIIDLVAISVETLRIDIGWSLEKEFTYTIDLYESPNNVILNYQLGQSMSELYK